MNNRPVIGVRLPAWAGSTIPVLAGIMDYMRVHGLWRIVTENNSYGEMESVKIGKGWQGDGLILYRATPEELEDFKARGVAVVLLSTEGPDVGFPRVLPDNIGAGELAAKHFLSLGLKSFAYLARGETFYMEAEFAPGLRIYARERLSGFKAAVETAGYSPNVYYLPGYPLWDEETWVEIEETVAGHLASLPKFTGLFVADDALAAVVLRAAARIGRNVPNEIAVLGFGDDPYYCHAFLPALSTIPYPARDVGQIAAQKLAEQMLGAGREAENERLPIGSVIQRESTDVISIEDEETARLVRWIRLRAPSEPLQVSDLEEQSEYSLSSIKSRFKKHLGRSPKDEIKRVRMDHLRHILQSSQLSFGEISEMMKFSSPHEMSRFFLRETGERPSSFRERQRKSL